MAKVTGFTEGLSELELDRLIKIYEKAETDILKEIKTKNLLNRKDKEYLLVQIKTILTDLYNPTAEFLTNGIREQKSIGENEVKSDLLDVNVDQAFSLISKDALKFLASNFDDVENLAYQEVKEALSYSFEGIKKLFNDSLREYKTEVLTDIASGQIKGYGAKKLTQIITQKLEEKGLKTIGNQQLKTVIKGTVQSTLINSRMSAVVQSALNAGFDLVKVSIHSNPSPMCSPYQGVIVSITGQTKGYKTLSDILFKGNFGVGGGILHRFCHHSLTVYIPTNIKFV